MAKPFALTGERFFISLNKIACLVFLNRPFLLIDKTDLADLVHFNPLFNPLSALLGLKFHKINPGILIRTLAVFIRSSLFVAGFSYSSDMVASNVVGVKLDTQLADLIVLTCHLKQTLTVCDVRL